MKSGTCVFTFRSKQPGNCYYLQKIVTTKYFDSFHIQVVICGELQFDRKCMYSTSNTVLETLVCSIPRFLFFVYLFYYLQFMYIRIKQKVCLFERYIILYPLTDWNIICHTYSLGPRISYSIKCLPLLQV